MTDFLFDKVFFSFWLFSEYMINMSASDINRYYWPGFVLIICIDNETSTNRARVPQVLPSTGEMPELKIWDKNRGQTMMRTLCALMCSKCSGSSRQDQIWSSCGTKNN